MIPVASRWVALGACVFSIGLHIAVVAMLNLEQPIAEMAGGLAGETIALGSGFRDTLAVQKIVSSSHNELLRPVSADLIASRLVTINAGPSLPPHKSWRTTPAHPGMIEPVSRPSAMKLPAIHAHIQPYSADTQQILSPRPLNVGRIAATLAETVLIAKIPASKKRRFNSEASDNSRKGSMQGKKEGQSVHLSNSGKDKTRAGNAAHSNYPGKIYTKIARARRKMAGTSGVAHVSFHILTSGMIEALSIAHSSGNRRVDRAALAHVKRAAPFQRPPAGAQRKFIIPIEFKW